jgi:hypothetical protein
VHHEVTAIKLFQYPCRISKNPVTSMLKSKSPFHIEEEVWIDNVFKNRTKPLKPDFY